MVWRPPHRELRVKRRQRGRAANKGHPGRQAAEPPDPTKQNATFLGWFTESGKHWNFAHDPVNENITLYAKWSDGKLPDPPEPKRFTVTFNANGGDGVMEPLTVTEGSSCRLPACTFTAPEGKEFDTWEIDGAKYGESALYPVTANTEVKVLWKDAGDTPTNRRARSGLQHHNLPQ